jgi:hypothetical protein
MTPVASERLSRLRTAETEGRSEQEGMMKEKDPMRRLTLAALLMLALASAALAG